MTRDEFDQFCGSLTATTNVIQWGRSSVWKVGGKIFALCSRWGDGNDDKVCFKCSDLAYQMLTQEDGIIPAPYLARAKWVQVQDANALNDEELRDYIRTAHKLIAAKLTRKQRLELGL